jgi:hypothetical protein
MIKNSLPHAFRTLEGIELRQVLKFLSHLSAITKSAYFEDAVFGQYAGGFKITMDILLFSQIQKAVDDVPEDSDSLRLLEMPTVTDFVLKVPFVTEFGNDVTVVHRTVDIVTMDDVRVLQFLQSLRFEVQYLFRKIRLSIPQIDYRYDHPILRLFVNALKNVALHVQVQVVVQPVRILLDLLPHLVRHTQNK